MGLLNKDFKSNTSSIYADVEEKYRQYFTVGSTYELNVKSNSLTLNIDKPHRYAYIDLSDLKRISDELGSLTDFYINNDLGIGIHTNFVNSYTGSLSHIHANNVEISDWSEELHVLDLSDMNFDCNIFTISYKDTCVKNITLRTKEMYITIDDNIDQLYCVQGNIKTDTVLFYLDQSGYFGAINLTNSISQISNPLLQVFKSWVCGARYYDQEDIMVLNYINPIMALGLEYYGATNYHFALKRNSILTFTKDEHVKDLKGTIKMADGWYAVYDIIGTLFY